MVKEVHLFIVRVIKLIRWSNLKENFTDTLLYNLEFLREEKVESIKKLS